MIKELANNKIIKTIAVVAASLLVAGVTYYIGYKAGKRTLQPENLNTALLIDSIASEQARDQVKRLDNLRAIEAAIAEKWQGDAEKWQQEAQEYRKRSETLSVELGKLLIEYKYDETQQTDLCDTIIDRYANRVELLTFENNSLVLANSALDNTANAYLHNLTLCDEQRQIDNMELQRKEAMIKQLQIQLIPIKDKNWIQRNAGWISFIGGAAAGGAIIYGVTK